MALLGSDAASMQVLDEAGNRLTLVASRNFDEASTAFWETVDVSSESSCGQAMRIGSRIVVAGQISSRLACATEAI
jgi:hypothetical protein